VDDKNSDTGETRSLLEAGSRMVKTCRGGPIRQVFHGSRMIVYVLGGEGESIAKSTTILKVGVLERGFKRSYLGIKYLTSLGKGVSNQSCLHSWGAEGRGREACP